MDPDQCRTLAQKVMQLYDSNNDGYVDSFEIGYMLSDCYRAMNKGFNPTPTDVASYARGRIHIEDVEKLCLKYFSGNFGSGGGQGGFTLPGTQSMRGSVPLKNPIAPPRLNRIA